MNNKESSVKKMQKKLYAKKDTFRKNERKHFSHTEDVTPHEWKDEVPKKVEEKKVAKKKPMTAFTKMLIGAALFFFVSLSIAFAVFTSGQNQVSYERVTLSVLGPNSAPGGEVLSFDVMIANDNDVDIALTDIIVNYESGAFEAKQDGVALIQEVRSVDEIRQGANHSERFDVVFFGIEGEVQDITITYEYRVPGSNTILFKERVYQVQLESSPISLKVDAPQESLSGSDVEIDVEITSNANKQIHNLTFQVDYPFGFEFQESAPAPAEGTRDVFAIGTLGVGETKNIKIIGSVSGQDDESRVFKYRIGLLNNAGDALENILQETDSVVSIARPPVTLTSSINTNTQSLHLLSPDETVRVELSFLNNLATQINEGVITASITGSAFSSKSIETNGFYNSSENKIIWQKTDIPVLGSFESGNSGKVVAKIRLFKLKEMAGRIVDPEVDIIYEFDGTTFDFENNEKPVTAKGITKIKIPTELELQSRLIHSIGPFENDGPLQLTADVASDYTLVWKISNTTSIAENVQVEAVLPPYVEFKGAQNKENSVFEYNKQDRIIKWTVDTIPAGAGYSSAGAEIAFQISITPSTSQEGDVLKITQDQKMKAFDSFTKTARIYSDLLPETTDSLESDPEYNGTAERVIIKEEGDADEE